MPRYTLLLVDDEQIIRDGISRKIDWDGEGFEFLPPCEDGESAIAAIRENPPDVIITDICMPQKDGLEVARYASENSPESLVVILSGYEDFDYARQALLYNVHEYVLKPLSSRKIRELLERIRTELKRREDFQIDMNHLLALKEEHKQILHERFLCRILTRPLHPAELENNKDQLPGQDLDNDFYSALIIIMDHSEVDRNSPFTPDLYLLAVREEAEKLLDKVPRMMICQSSEQSVNLIIHDKGRDSLQHTGRFVAEQLHKSLNLLPEYSCSLGLGNPVSGIAGLHLSYSQARTALDNRMIIGGRNVFYYQDSSRRMTARQNRIRQLHERILSVLKQESEASVSALLDDYIFALRESGLNAVRIRLEINKLTFLIIDFLGTLEEGIPAADINRLSESLSVVSDLDNLNSVEERLNKLISEIASVMREHRRNYPEKKISHIQSYLETNYGSPDIDVDFITNLFFISPSYLSKLFRQFTGKTFVEYLTSLRVSKACELLKTSDLKLMDIAEQVGYADQRYFSSIFKKYTGKTPSQYRNHL